MGWAAWPGNGPSAASAIGPPGFRSPPRARCWGANHYEQVGSSCPGDYCTDPVPVMFWTVEVAGAHLGVSAGAAWTAGWSFVHGMLHESLERQVRDGGRWAELHQAAATMLRSRSGVGVAERLGRHLLEAGQVAEAVEPLSQGLRERVDLGELAQAQLAAGLLEQVMLWTGPTTRGLQRELMQS